MTSEHADREGKKPSSPGWLVASLLLGGAGLRVGLGFESFWLDEAWSYLLSTQASSALEIFGIRHDNNHLLNTLYLYSIRDLVGSSHWIFYRVPALLAGCISLFVLWRLASHWSRSEALVLLALAATSFPLASASAQARGYSLAILCSILYALLARRSPGAAEARTSLGLGMIAVLGLLSHVTFVYTWLAVVAWFASRDGARTLLLRHGVPLACIVGLYIGFYSGVEVGGGPSYDRFVTIRQAISQTMALPRRGVLTWLAMAFAVILIVRGLVLLGRRRDSRGIFLAVALGVAPGLVILVADPGLLYARYLLLVFPWFYWIVAIVVADELSQGGARRVLAVCVLSLFALSNLWHATSVIREGRNDYVRTLAYIDEHSDGSRLEIGGDHAFRNETVLRFHANRIKSGRPVVYLAKSGWPEQGPEWYLRHDWKAGNDPERMISLGPGLVYQRVVSFEHGPGDGFQWFVYRRAKLRATGNAAPSPR